MLNNTLVSVDNTFRNIFAKQGAVPDDCTAPNKKRYYDIFTLNKIRKQVDKKIL